MNLSSVEVSTVQATPNPSRGAAVNAAESADPATKEREAAAKGDFHALVLALQEKKGGADTAVTAESVDVAAAIKEDAVAEKSDLQKQALALLGESDAAGDDAAVMDSAGAQVKFDKKTQKGSQEEEASTDGVMLPFGGMALPPLLDALSVTGKMLAAALGANLKPGEFEEGEAAADFSLLKSKSEQSMSLLKSDSILTGAGKADQEQDFIDELHGLLAMMPGVTHDESAKMAGTNDITALVQNALASAIDGSANQASTAVASMAHSVAGMAASGSTAVTQSDPAIPRQLMEQPLNLNGSEWVDGFAERILWASKNQFHYAEIQLDPPELGALQVRIQIRQDQAQVQFITPHHQVREAIEGTLDRLRDLFNQQGMQLVHSQVADGGGRNSGQQEFQRDGWRRFAEDAPVVVDESVSQSRSLREGALIDRYA